MGNTSGKHQSYQQYYESMQQNNTNIEQLDITSLDPYKVLNVPKNFTWNQLKDAYKEAAIKTHPDKGGNKIIFDFVTTCFKTLAEEYKAKHSNKSHHDMKKEAAEYFEKMTSTNTPHPSSLNQYNQNEPFERRFNKVFDDCRYQDEETEYGYGNMMTQSSGKREDISIENVFNKSKVNNETFNEMFNKRVPVATKELIKYKEPEALPMAKNLQFTEIGSKRPDDYSSDTTKNNLAYTDYMKAYSGMRLANPDDIKTRKDFKSVEEYEKYRDSKAKRGLTEKERRYMEEQKRLEEKQEFERQERIRLQNIAIQKAHEKANRFLLQ